jgi:hypothetical protein
MEVSNAWLVSCSNFTVSLLGSLGKQLSPQNKSVTTIHFAKSKN